MYARYSTYSKTRTTHLPHKLTPCWGCSLRRTCVVLSFQVQVVEFVNVADVHFLLVQLGFVEVLAGAVGGFSRKKTKQSWSEFRDVNEHSV